jgi:hypothetical protein
MAVSQYVEEVTNCSMCRESPFGPAFSEFTNGHMLMMSEVGGIHTSVANRSFIKPRDSDQAVTLAAFLGDRLCLVSNCALVKLRVASLDGEGSSYSTFRSESEIHATAYERTARFDEPEEDDESVFCGDGWLSDLGAAEGYDFFVSCMSKCPVMVGTQMLHDSAVARGEEQARSISALSAGLCTARMVAPTWDCGECKQHQPYGVLECQYSECGSAKKWNQWDVGDPVRVEGGDASGVIAGCDVSGGRVLLHGQSCELTLPWSEIMPDPSMYPVDDGVPTQNLQDAASIDVHGHGRVRRGMCFNSQNPVDGENGDALVGATITPSSPGGCRPTNSAFDGEDAEGDGALAMESVPGVGTSSPKVQEVDVVCVDDLHPRLYVGSKKSLKNPDELEKLGINVVFVLHKCKMKYQLASQIK